jgi:hypothetical protein
MLSDAELTDMQAEREENMPETVYIQKKTSVSNAAGGFYEAYSTESTVNGRIGAVGKSPEEKEIASRIANVVGYTVVLPVDAVVDETYQLQINGRQFLITGVIRKSRQTALRVVCTEVS